MLTAQIQKNQLIPTHSVEMTFPTPTSQDDLVLLKQTKANFLAAGWQYSTSKAPQVPGTHTWHSYFNKNGSGPLCSWTEKETVSNFKEAKTILGAMGIEHTEKTVMLEDML